MSKLSDIDRDLDLLNLKPGKNYFGFVFTLPFTDKRLPSLIRELETTGMDRSETWTAFLGFAGYLHSRLTLFKEHTRAHPFEVSFEDWNSKLSNWIETFKEIKDDLPNEFEDNRNSYFDKIQENLNDFAKYFLAIWW